MDWRIASASVRRFRRKRREEDSSACVRPSIPPALGMGLAFWASSAAAVSLGRVLGVRGCVLAALGSAALIPFGLLLLRRLNVAYPCAVAVAILAGALSGYAGCATVQLQGQSVSDEPVAIALRAVEDADSTSYGKRVLSQVETGPLSGAKVQVLYDGDEAIRYGQRFHAEGSIRCVDGASAEYLWGKGCVLQVRAGAVDPLPAAGIRDAVAAVRERALTQLEMRGGQDAALVAALACGWRRSIDVDLGNAFKAAGLSHLIAVSGAHLSLVAAFAAAVLGVLRCPRALAIPLQVALIASFLLLSGASPSAIRASVMAFCAMGSFFARRRPSSLGALGVCMIAFVAVDPFVSVSVSFALSTLSTLGIVLFGRLVQCWLGWLVPWMPQFAQSALALTLASNLAATLYGSALFSQLSLIAPVANVLAAPLFAPACIGSVAVSLMLGFCTALPGWAVDAACLVPGVLAETVRLCASVPYASVVVSLNPLLALAVSGAAAALLYRCWPAPGVLAERGCRRFQVAIGACSTVAVVLVAVLLPLFVGGGAASLVMLDVGQGDAILLKGTRATVLVDTGNKPSLLREALARNNVLYLDAVVLTHSDDDHYGCLADLKGVVQVGSVMVASDGLLCPCGSCDALRDDARLLVGEEGLVGLAAGDVLDLGALGLEVLWPVSYRDEGGNGDSLCLLVSVDADSDGMADYKGLLTGDAEREQLAALVEEGALGRVDFLKVGHHGSKNALDAEVAQALSPAVSLISCGAGNRYGHPSADALELLEGVGSIVFRTDEQGDVACWFDARGMEVR